MQTDAAQNFSSSTSIHTTTYRLVENFVKKNEIMSSIPAEVANPDKEIRHAALETIIQSQDQSAIPLLREIAATTEDAEEKTAVLAAVKFMNLPSPADTLDAPGRSQAGTASPDNSQGFTRFHALLDAHLRHPQRENSSLPLQVGQ